MTKEKASLFNKQGNFLIKESRIFFENVFVHHNITRQSKKMKRTLIAIAILSVCLLSLVSCSRKRTLHIYIWADYISEDVIKEFEKAYDCKVQQDIFDSNEMMFAKLQAGGTGYDIVCPSHYFIHKMAAQHLIQKLDYGLLPNVSEHLDPSTSSKFDQTVKEYSVPYFMSYTGIGYSKSIVKDFEPTWNILLRHDMKDRVTLLDDYVEIIGAAARTLGYSFEDLNDPEDGDSKMNAVIELALKWRGNVLKFDNEQYKNGLATGEFSLVMGYFSDLAQIVAENEDLALALPKEGCMMSCDMLAIPTGARNPDLAYAFINFVHEPKNAAKNIAEVYAYCPNVDAVELLDEEILEDESIFPDKEILENSVMIPELSPEQEERYLKAWNRIRSGK